MPEKELKVNDWEDLYLGSKTIKFLGKNKDIPRTYLGDIYFPIEKKMDISQKFIRIGKIKLNDPNDEFWLDIKEVHRTLILGMTRSGKTLIQRRFMDLFHASGFDVVWLTDVSDEVKSSKRELQPKLRPFLHPNDIPAPLQLKVYRPMFFKEFNNDLPSDNEWFKLSYKDLTFGDLIMAFGFDSPNFKNYVDILSLYWNKVNSLEQLKEKIETAKLNPRVKAGILRPVESLIKYDVFGEEKVGDFIADMNNGFVVAFNFKGHEEFGDSSLNTIPQVYASIIQNIIVKSRDKGILKRRILLIIDEASKFLKQRTLMHDSLKSAVNEYAKYGIYIYFSTQTTKDVPDWLIRQCRYIFFPFNVDPETALQILKRAQLYDFHPSWHRDIIARLREMRMRKDGRRQWCVVDMHLKEETVFWNFPPLSAHQESL